MSYQQQRSVAAIVTGAIVVAGYFTMALGRLEADSLRTSSARSVAS